MDKVVVDLTTTIKAIVLLAHLPAHLVCFLVSSLCSLLYTIICSIVLNGWGSSRSNHYFPSYWTSCSSTAHILYLYPFNWLRLQEINLRMRALLVEEQIPEKQCRGGKKKKEKWDKLGEERKIGKIAHFILQSMCTSLGKYFVKSSTVNILECH